MHRRVVVFVGDYGAHLPYFPLVGRIGQAVVVFVDHRRSPRERQRALDAAVPPDEVASIEVVRTAPATTPDDCSAGIHLWNPIERDGETVGATCRYCPAVEDLRPISASITRVPLKLAS